MYIESLQPCTVIYRTLSMNYVYGVTGHLTIHFLLHNFGSVFIIKLETKSCRILPFIYAAKYDLT